MRQSRSTTDGHRAVARRRRCCLIRRPLLPRPSPVPCLAGQHAHVHEVVLHVRGLVIVAVLAGEVLCSGGQGNIVVLLLFSAGAGACGSCAGSRRRSQWRDHCKAPGHQTSKAQQCTCNESSDLEVRSVVGCPVMRRPPPPPIRVRQVQEPCPASPCSYSHLHRWTHRCRSPAPCRSCPSGRHQT